MKLGLTIALLNLVTLHASFAYSQASYREANIEAHRVNLGYDPEEFLEEGMWYTSSGNVEYGTLFINNLHAILFEDTPYYTGGRTAFLLTFGEFSMDELNTLDAMLAFGIQADTINKTIKDHDDNLLELFTSPTDFYDRIFEIIYQVVEEDIDVQPVGFLENSNIGACIIYPYGNSDFMKIDAKDRNDEFSLEILGIDGKGYLYQTFEGEIVLNLNPLSKGVYVLRIYSYRWVHSRLFLKY